MAVSDSISILIPTRERRQLARLAVEAALDGTDEGCQVIVADNNDVALELPDHARLRHLHPTGRPLSMPDNWERALEAADGSWLMMLSDKYMLVPGTPRTLQRLVSERSLKVVSYGTAVLRQNLREDEAKEDGRLRTVGGDLQAPARTEYAALPAAGTLDGIYRQAGRYAPRAPMLYTALVHRSVADAVRARHGRFFFGPCPDIASALQILSSIDTYLETSLPAIMIQYPTASAEWSTGLSTVVQGQAAKRFLFDLGGGERKAAGNLVASLILDTLIASPGAQLSRQSVQNYAWEASREISGHPILRQPGLQWDLLRRVLPGGGLSAAWIQLRAALGYHLPGAVSAGLLSLRRQVLAPFGATSQPRVEEVFKLPVESRDDALTYLRHLADPDKVTPGGETSVA